MENLAQLARIELNENEKKDLLSEMEGILSYVKQIEKVKVDDMKNDENNVNIWREDILEPREFSRESMVEQFPDSQN